MPDELRHFDGRLDLDVTKTPFELASMVLEALRSRRWCPRLDEDYNVTARVEKAWKAHQAAERQWAKEQEAARRTDLSGPASAPVPPVPGPSQHWKLQVPEVAKVLAQRKLLPDSLAPCPKPCVSLLCLEAHELQLLTQEDGLPEVQAMREVLDGLRGEELELTMVEIVIDSKMACAVVSLPPIVPCRVKVPHIILGVAQDIPDSYAEELLGALETGQRPDTLITKLPSPRPIMGRLTLDC